MTIMAEVNCSHRIAHGPLPLLSSSSFGPHSSNRRAASSSLSPDSAPVSRARSTSSASDVCHALSSPRRSLPIREPPSRALPACLPKVGPGYGASVFPDSLALRLYACWGGSRHSSVTSGSAYTVSYRRVRSPGYRTSRFRSRGVHRPPARSCLRGATPPRRRSRSGHASARTSPRHPGRWDRPPPPLPSAKLSSSSFRLRMVMVPAGHGEGIRVVHNECLVADHGHLVHVCVVDQLREHKGRNIRSRYRLSGVPPSEKNIVFALGRFVSEPRRTHDYPIEIALFNCLFLAGLVLVDVLHHERQHDPIVEKTDVTLAVTGSDAGYADQATHPVLVHRADDVVRTLREKGCGTGAARPQRRQHGILVGYGRLHRGSI